MFNKILIRYGELSLKKGNKFLFINQLKRNIQNILKITPTIEHDRMYIPYTNSNMENLQYIFGIYSYSPVIETSLDIKDMEKIAHKILAENKPQSFIVQAKRSSKTFTWTSSQINAHLGGYLQKVWPNLEVKAKNSDLKLEINIRKKSAFLFIKRVKGLGGLPTGIQGKVLHLISGGIDSPVAAFQMMKRGSHVDFLNFITPPQTDEQTILKVENLIAMLVKYQGKTKLYQFNFSNLMNLISLTSSQKYKIILMRRSFYRIANQIGITYKYKGLSNGDNIGQVASQTLEAINVISSQSQMPIYRPLATADKLETIEKGKQIKTYYLSIQETKETCELFAPKNPITAPKNKKAQELESELENLDKLEKEGLANKIRIKEFKT